jgi:hypothetical protein
MNMTNINSTSLFILIDIILKSVDEDEFLLEDDEVTLYKQIVGSVLYFLNNTRFNTLYAVEQLARFMSKPAIIYLRIYKHLL